MKNFILRIVLLTVAIAVIAAALFSTVLQAHYHNFYWFLLLFIAGITTAVHAVLIRVNKQRQAKFTAGFMLATTVKLMIYLFTIVIYTFMNRDTAVPFLIAFIILYFAYTVLEIVSILPQFKNDSTNN